jgi:hypothetical protein
MRSKHLSTALAHAFAGLFIALSGAAGQADEASAPKLSLNAQRPPADFLARPGLVLDESDEIATLQAIHMALQTVGDGGAYLWQRGHGLLDGMIRPTTSFKGQGGEVCRHIVIRLNYRSYSREAEGIACRDENGRWSLSG